MSPLFLKVGEDPLGSSRPFRKRVDECRAGDLLCMYGSQCMGCITTRPRLIQSSSEETRISDESKGSLLPSHADLLWSCPTLKILSPSIYLYIFFQRTVGWKNKDRNIRVCLSAIIVACSFWKLNDKMFMPHFSSLSLTQLGCPGREASSKLNTVSLAF